MTQTRQLLRSFSGGEISPEMAGRVDLAKYRTGLKLCRNFVTLPHGPAQTRAGTRFIRAVKENYFARLIPFTYSVYQTYILEFGDYYVRFHTNGGTLMSDGLPVEVVTPYSWADVWGLKYTQSADVMTLVHVSYAPWLLKRNGDGSFTGATETHGPALAAPTGVTCDAWKNASYGSPAVYPYMQNQHYVVTAVSNDGVSESVASAVVTSMSGTQHPTGSSVGNKLSDYSNYNKVAWSAVSGAARYNVYKNTDNSGIYGYIGQTKALNFTDNNVTPDFTKTPPETGALFDGGVPGAVTYHEQRKVFGGGALNPQTLWMTRSGTETDFRRSLPARDDDAITARIVSREVMAIRHIVPLSDLVLLTSGGEWRVAAQQAEALTPYSISVRQQSYTGASDVVPVLTGNACIYVQAKGAHLRELSYQWQNQAFQSLDLCLFAPHLFYGHSIIQLAFTQAPYPIIWALRDDGVLLGCTYVPEQDVVAWHQHTTDGAFESIAAVSEGNADVLYCIVHRVIGGVDKRYVERMDTRQFTTLADAFCVDAGLTYSGAPATVISGLAHLEGKSVVALADGVPRGPFTVAGGSITLPVAASKVHAGLPIIADLATLPALVDQEGAAGYGWPKNVGYVSLGLYQTPKISIGPDAARLTVIAPGGLWSGQTEKKMLASQWDHVGTVYVHHSDPTPVTFTNLAMEVSLGG